MASPAVASRDCSKCGQHKPLEDFQPNPNGRSGRKSTCRDCNRMAAREWKQANVDKTRAHKRVYWDAHKDRLNEERRTPDRRDRANALRRQAWNEDSQRFHRDEREKKNARWNVWKAVAAGELVREDCARCGASQVQAHHEDYSKPLDVIWLCARCHSAVHRGAVI